LDRTSQAVRLLKRLGRQPYHDLPDLGQHLPAARVRGEHLEPGALMDVASFIDGAGEIAQRVAAFEAAPSLASRAAQVRPLGDLSASIRRAILPSGEVCRRRFAAPVDLPAACAPEGPLTPVMDRSSRGRTASSCCRTRSSPPQ
jgi:hypothetical protein